MRLLTVRGFFLFGASFLWCLCVSALVPVSAAEKPIGSVTKLQNDASQNRLGHLRPIAIGDPVYVNDSLKTGESARLEVTFLDNTKLILGADAHLTVNKFVYDPKQGVGKVLLGALKGALRLVTGRIATFKSKEVNVQTEFAIIGVRGTDFFAGHALTGYGVLLFDGVITVRNDAGGRLLNKSGTGTSITRPDTAPGEVSSWGESRVQAALEAVSFN